ncbi:MAG: hypothetical protein ACRDPG_04300 [Nocardioidaceae bacterium]
MSDYRRSYRLFQTEVRRRVGDESRPRPQRHPRPSVVAGIYRISLATAIHHHPVPPAELTRFNDEAFEFVRSETGLPKAVLRQAIRLDRVAWEAFDAGLDDTKPRQSLELLDQAYESAARYP